MLHTRRRAVSGLKVAGATQAGKTLVDAGANFALLYLLAPQHFGVFAIAQALTGFISCFSDAAGQKFIVRRRENDPRAISTVFWFEFLLGLAVATLWAVFCGPVLAAIGHADQVDFARALAIWIVAERLMLPRAVLDRDMRFHRTNAALFGGVLVGSSALVSSAALGFGAWSFIIGLVVRTLASAALLWRMSGFRPAFALRLDVVRPHLGFGLPLLLTTALVFAYTNVDYLIIGKVLGLEMLGLYYAAYRYPHYLNQFNVVLSSVVFPSFARAHDDAHLARGLRLVTRYAAFVAFLPVVLMWAEGRFLVGLLLEDKWLPALFPFQCFTTLAAARLTFSHWGHVYVAKGHTLPLLGIGAVNLPLIGTAAAVGAVAAGIDGAAVGVTSVACATLAFCCGVLLKRSLPGFSYLESLAPAAIAAGCAAALAVAMGFLGGAGGAAWSLATLGAVTAAYGVVGWSLCRSELRRVFAREA